METWDLLEDGTGEAARNMAFDEALLQTAADRDRALLRIYSWTRPAITFGYFQPYPRSLAGQFAIVRRPTGGGLVYHGEDTTYTVVAPRGHRLFALGATAAYAELHCAVAAACAAAVHESAVRSPRGVYECFQEPVAGDVVADGRKRAGGAQRRTKRGMLHQGSILPAVDRARLRAAFTSALGVEFAAWEPPAAVVALADQLEREKYSTAAWNERIS